MPNDQTIAITVTIVVLIVMLVMMAVLMQFFALYTRALLSGAPVTVLDVLGMKLRRVNARMVVDAWIQARRERIGVTLADLETHVLAGGDLPHVMSAVIAAKKMGKELDWKQATAMDLAQRDVVEFVASGAHERGQEWLSAPMRRRQPLI
jgi:uncharacterized protein YqfA (UPF0365 family)